MEPRQMATDESGKMNLCTGTLKCKTINKKEWYHATENNNNYEHANAFKYLFCFGNGPAQIRNICLLYLNPGRSVISLHKKNL